MKDLRSTLPSPLILSEWREATGWTDRHDVVVVDRQQLEELVALHARNSVRYAGGDYYELSLTQMVLVK